MQNKTQDLIIAIENYDKTKVYDLLDESIDVSAQTKDGSSVLMKLAEYSDDKLFLKALKSIEESKNIQDILNQPNQYGETVLMQTAKYFADEKISQKLIDLGANVHARDNMGTTPLMYACTHQNIDVVDLFLQHKSVPYATDNHGFTPLMAVAANGNVEIAKHLINYGTALNTQNECGNTALMIASQNENKDMVAFLLRVKADRSLKNNEGKNARRIAYDTGNRDILRLFVQQESVFKKVVTFLSLGYNKEQHTR